MEISSTYASRADLSSFAKWQFTIEERIEKSARARAFYRWYYFLPKWVTDTLVGTWFAVSILPLLLMGLCEDVVQRIIGPDEDGASRAEGTGLLLYSTVLLVLPFYFPLMWIVVAMTVQFIVILKFYDIMCDYDMQLRRESAR